jgi:hypothetical protein
MVNDFVFKNLEYPIFTSIKNLEDFGKEGSTAFSFKSTKLRFEGIFFLSKPIIRFKNGLTSKVFDVSNSDYGDKFIFFTAPPISSFNIEISVRFPLTFKVGISVDNGFSFVEREIIYVDKYADLLLFQLAPQIMSKTHQTLSIQGVGFEFATHCLFKNGSTILFQSPVQIITNRSLECNISSVNANLADKMDVSLRNSFNDTSNIIPIQFYG